jgi:hypothetical protein
MWNRQLSAVSVYARAGAGFYARFDFHVAGLLSLPVRIDVTADA